MDVAEAATELGAEGDERRPRPLLVDVRERGEFATVRIPGAILLPLSEIQTGLERLPRDPPLLLHCAAGKRSLVAAEFLKRNGFQDVASVDGGIIAWQKAGYPVTDAPATPGEGDLPA